MKSKFLSLVSLALVLAAALSACAPAATPTPEVITKVETQVIRETEVVMITPTPEAVLATVKLGVLLPLTGPLSEFGENFRLSALLAKQDLRLAGIPVDLIFADTETSAIPGVDAARLLVDVEGVQALIGAAASGVTQPVAESVSIPSEVPQISNASTSPLLTVLPADEGKDFLFRTCPSDAIQGVALAALAAETLGYKKVAIMFVNNAYGQGLAEQFKESFEFRDGEVTAMIAHDEAPAATYVSELRSAAEGEPEVLLAISYPGHATVYLKEAIEGAFFDTFLFCDGTKSELMPQEVGSEYLAGMHGTMPVASEAASPEVFDEGFAMLFGQPPALPFMTNLYDAIAVARLAAAALEIQGLDITPVGIRDMLREVANPPGVKIAPGPEGLALAVELLGNGEGINYEGVNGLDFDEYGDMVGPIEVWKYIEEEPWFERVDVVTKIPAK